MNKVNEAFHLPQHLHDFIELNYVSEGQGFHYLNEHTIPVSKGDLFIIPVGTAHVFRPSSANRDKRLTIYNIVFQSNLLEAWLANMPGSEHIADLFSSSNSVPWKLSNNSEQIVQLIESMYIEYRLRDLGCETVLVGQLLQLLTLIVRLQSYDQDTERPNNQTSVQNLLSHIQTHCADSKFKMHDLADMTGLTVNQIHYRLTQYTGYSFGEYIRKLRIEEAIRLLTSTDDKVYQIAERVGYHDMKVFHAVFKAETGTTPRQFRQFDSSNPTRRTDFPHRTIQK